MISRHLNTSRKPCDVQLEKRSKIVDFYQNRSVLITGGSGFIGKVMIEKLLRTCPGIKRIFVLIRPKWSKQPNERLQELLKAPLFDRLRAQQAHSEGASLEEKVVVVEGDVTQPNLGLTDQNLLRIMNEVSVIYHSAATVKFDEPLKQSVAINIAGTKNMIDICRKIPQLAALVHVSTAYANCDKQVIDEHIYPVDMDPEKLIELANWLDQDTLQELKLRLLGARPNTYTYTKALAEWLLIKCARDLPVVICRPSIVVASWKEPFSGWIDNVNGPTGIILGAGKGLVRSLHAQNECVADLVPVDVVTNLVIVLGWFAHIYRNHKQLNDVAESLSESLIGSGASSLGDESSDELFDSDRINQLVNEQTGGNFSVTLLETNGNERDINNGEHCNNNNSASNNNNNNNNNYTDTMHVFPASDYEATGGSRLDGVIGTGSRANKMKHDSDLYSTNHNDTLTVGGRHQFVNQLDDGYGSNSQSPDAKSTASCSSLSCSSIINNNQSTIDQIDRTGTTSESNKSNGRQGLVDTGVISFVAQRRLAEQKHAAFEYKLKQFRHNTQVKLTAKQLPEDLADIPVFHCTSGSENPIIWRRISMLIVSILALYPSISTYRYPKAYTVDFITKLLGGKPVLVKIFKKFDQASKVLHPFLSNEWQFNVDNRLMLFNELMSEEDKRLFNLDLRGLDWPSFLRDYVLGVRNFVLKEPISNLAQARTNLQIVYYRNLSLQVLLFASLTYCLLTNSLVANLLY